MHCLDSIAAQSYHNIEVIISDNASTDNTVDIIKTYADRYGFQFFVNKRNIGAGANFNRLLGLAKGDYVAIYHADDMYGNTIVQDSVRVLDLDDTIGLVGTMGDLVNEEGVPFNSFRLPPHLKKLNKTVYSFEEALSGIVKRGWFFVTPTIMVRRKVIDQLGTFNITDYGSSGDYELWMRIASNFKVAIIDKKLIRYRVHKNQGTEQEVRKNPEVADIVLVVKKYRDLTTNHKLKKMCDDCINSNIVKAARRQNYYGLYDKSSQTLKLLKSNNIRFLLHKYGIRFFNALKFSIKKRRLA